MGSFGEQLRREREMRGITLEAVSRSTKIRTHILEALENQEFEKLPSGVFKKGIVRSYARFLGMNEKQVLKAFLELAGDPEQPLPDPLLWRRRRPKIPLKQDQSWGRIATVVVCATVLLVAGWKTAQVVHHAAATWSGVHRARSSPPMTAAESSVTNNASATSSPRNGPSASALATDQPEDAVATLQPASQMSTSPTPEPVPAAASTRAEKFVILVKANQPAWVSITADGKRLLEGVLERRTKIRAYSEVTLTTNNAGALALSRNGKPRDSEIYSSPVSEETRELDSGSLPRASNSLDTQNSPTDQPNSPQSPDAETPPEII
jgi:cytoskeleton protein RodZ